MDHPRKSPQCRDTRVPLFCQECSPLLSAEGRLRVTTVKQLNTKFPSGVEALEKALNSARLVKHI